MNCVAFLYLFPLKGIIALYVSSPDIGEFLILKVEAIPV